MLGCTQSLSSHCTAKMSLILVLVVPRLSAPLSGPILPLWDQSWGPRDWPGLRSRRGAAPPLLAAQSCSLSASSRLQGCLGGGHSREDGAAGAQQSLAEPLHLPLTLHLHMGRLHGVIPAAPGHGPPSVCLGGTGGAATVANTAGKSGSGSHCTRPRDGPGSSAELLGRLRCSGCRSSQLGQPRMRRGCLDWLGKPLRDFLLS